MGPVFTTTHTSTLSALREELGGASRLFKERQLGALAACFGATAEVLWHDGGHVMPPRPQLLEAAEFLARHWSVGGRPASAAEEEITMF